MNFHIGKIYKMPSNFYFYKSNQPRLWDEYCKKIKIPVSNLDNSYIEYCKNITIFSESIQPLISDSDDDSWVDMKKIL